MNAALTWTSWIPRGEVMIHDLLELRVAMADPKREEEVTAWFNTIPLYPRGVLHELLEETERW